MMAGKNTQSKHIMHRIPTGSIGCEIGVWKGETSQLFLERQLKQLHLVDPYSTAPYNTPALKERLLSRYKNMIGSDKEEDFQKYYDQIYDGVKTKFSKYPEVRIHRMTSTEYFNSIEDRSLDWIYIDGAHDFEGCLKDLKQAWTKVKIGGSIFGDDYKWGITTLGKPGVVQAVDAFSAEYKVYPKAFGETNFEIKVK